MSGNGKKYGADAFALRKRGAWIETRKARRTDAPGQTFALRKRGAWIETELLHTYPIPDESFALRKRGAWIETPGMWLKRLWVKFFRPPETGGVD